MKEKELKRLVLDIDPALHKLIKATAKFKNMTMKKYIIRTMVKKLARDRKIIEQEIN